MSRRNFFKKLAALGATTLASSALLGLNNKSDKPASADSENIYEFQLRTISDSTITQEEKELIKKLSASYLKQGKLVSFTKASSKKRLDYEIDYKITYVFDSKQSKLQYIADKDNILKEYKKRNNKASAV